MIQGAHISLRDLKLLGSSLLFCLGVVGLRTFFSYIASRTLGIKIPFSGVSSQTNSTNIPRMSSERLATETNSNCRLHFKHGR